MELTPENDITMLTVVLAVSHPQELTRSFIIHVADLQETSQYLHQAPSKKGIAHLAQSQVSLSTHYRSRVSAQTGRGHKQSSSPVE